MDDEQRDNEEFKLSEEMLVNVGRYLAAICIAIAAKIAGPLFALIMFFCVGLVINSGFEINRGLGFLTLAIVIVSYVIVGLFNLLGRHNVEIIHKGEKKPIERLTPIYYWFLVLGFLQIFFWVIDSENSIHEPRSIFILAVAGIMAYVRRNN